MRNPVLLVRYTNPYLIISFCYLPLGGIEWCRLAAVTFGKKELAIFESYGTITTPWGGM